MKKTILIVDDSASLRQVVNIALTGAGYDVIEAEDGAKALKKLDGAKISLVICDVNMPVMDGEHCIEEIRNLQDPVKANTLVIACTANPEEYSAQDFKNMGFDYGFIKPANYSNILAFAKPLMHRFKKQSEEASK